MNEKQIESVTKNGLNPDDFAALKNENEGFFIDAGADNCIVVTPEGQLVLYTLTLVATT